MKRKGCQVGYKRVKGKCIPNRDGVWRKIDKDTWQKLTKKYDISITKSGKNYYNLDIFDAKIKDHDVAYLKKYSGIYDSVTEAKKESKE